MASSTPKRVRKVSITSVMESLVDDSQAMTEISVSVVGKEEPVVLSISLRDAPMEYLIQAATAAITHRLQSCVNNIYGVEGMLKALGEEMGLHSSFTYPTRVQAKVKAPLIVRAWAKAAGVDVEDDAVLRRYVTAWEAKDDAGKGVIYRNATIQTVAAELKLEARRSEVVEEGVEEVPTL